MVILASCHVGTMRALWMPWERRWGLTVFTRFLVDLPGGMAHIMCLALVCTASSTPYTLRVTLFFALQAPPVQFPTSRPMPWLNARPLKMLKLCCQIRLHGRSMPLALAAILPPQAPPPSHSQSEPLVTCNVRLGLYQLSGWAVAAANSMPFLLHANLAAAGLTRASLLVYVCVLFFCIFRQA